MNPTRRIAFSPMTWRAALAAIIAAPAFALIPAHAQTTMPVQLQTFSFVSGDAAAGTVVRDAPYSGEGETTVSMTLSDGTRITRQVTAKYYRDSEGRIRREQTVLGLAALNPASDAEQVVTIVDPVAGVIYALNPTTRIAHRISYDKRAFTDAPPPPPGAVMSTRMDAGAGVAVAGVTGVAGAAVITSPGGGAGSGAVGVSVDMLDPAAPDRPSRTSAQTQEESLGTREVGGVNAVGHRTRTTIPAGQIGNDRPIEITDERWESPELKLLVYSKHHDPRTGDIEFRLKNLTRAEPGADLFEVPGDYTIAVGPPIPPPPPPPPSASAPQLRPRPQ